MPELCSIPTCTRPIQIPTYGWCKAHYMRWWKTGDTQPDRPLRPWTPQGTCNGPHCQRWARTHGYCWAHYTQLQRGNPLTPITTPPPKTPNGDVADEVEHLLGTDTPDNIAQRLGYRNRHSLERTLTRAGRTDLTTALQQTNPDPLHERRNQHTTRTKAA